MLLRQRLLVHHADPGRTQLKVPPTQPLARTWADAARLTAVYSLSVRLGLSRKAAGGRKRQFVQLAQSANSGLQTYAVTFPEADIQCAYLSSLRILLWRPLGQ